MTQTELFPEYAYSIEPITGDIIYKYAVKLNGEIICKFIALDMTLGYIKQKLRQAQMPYKRIMEIADKCLNDYRRKEDKL